MQKQRRSVRTPTKEKKISEIYKLIELSNSLVKWRATYRALCRSGIQCFVCLKPSAEYRIKKLIICSYSDTILFCLSCDDSSTNVDVYSFRSACQNPLLQAVLFVISNSFYENYVLCNIRKSNLIAALKGQSPTWIFPNKSFLFEIQK